MSRWSAEDIPDQSGRRVVVTGANSGLGFHTALELARHGAEVIMAVRDEAKGAEAVQRIRAEAPEARVEVRRLDLADLASVRAFADAAPERVDLLVNNAGVMAIPRRETADGFEMQLGTNHLGHFALTGLLLGRLLAAEDGGRVVTLSSGAHRIGRMSFDDLMLTNRYQRWRAYGQSKLANLLFAFELQRRADGAGVPLRSFAAHPGYAETNLQMRGPEMDGSAIKRAGAVVLNKLLAQDAAHGALPTLFVATEDIPGGAFAGPDGPFEQRGHPKLVGASRAARHEVDARRLWEASEELTGVRYEALAPAA